MYEQLFDLTERHFNVLFCVISILLIVGMITLALVRECNTKKYVVRYCIIGYVLILYLLTFGLRTEETQTLVVLEVRWIEVFLWSKSNLIWGDFANILLFIPYGIFSCELRSERNKFIFCIVGAMLVSGIIEILQLFTRRGYCDINDWFGNVFGVIIGYFIYYVISNYWMKIIRERIKN